MGFVSEIWWDNRAWTWAGDTPSSIVDTCRLRPKGIAGSARHQAIGMAAQHICTCPGAVWGNRGSQIDGSEQWPQQQKQQREASTNGHGWEEGLCRGWPWDPWGGTLEPVPTASVPTLTLQTAQCQDLQMLGSKLNLQIITKQTHVHEHCMCQLVRK